MFSKEVRLALYTNRLSKLNRRDPVSNFRIMKKLERRIRNLG